MNVDPAAARSTGPERPDGDAEPGPDADPVDRDGMAELLALVEELDADNERLRRRVLELLELMEETVTAQVAGERRIDELHQRCEQLTEELAAIEGTKVMRSTAALRRLYARIRSRRGTADA